MSIPTDRTITSLSPLGTLPCASKIRGVYIAYTGVQSLPLRLFDGLLLRSVQIIGNYDLQSLPADLLDGQPDIRSAKIYGNDRLHSLPAGLLDGKPIVTVELYGNAIDPPLLYERCYAPAQLSYNLHYQRVAPSCSALVAALPGSSGRGESVFGTCVRVWCMLCMSVCA